MLITTPGCAGRMPPWMLPVEMLSLLRTPFSCTILKQEPSALQTFDAAPSFRQTTSPRTPDLHAKPCLTISSTGFASASALNAISAAEITRIVFILLLQTLSHAGKRPRAEAKHAQDAVRITRIGDALGIGARNS
jgi:hypothetical protein